MLTSLLTSCPLYEVRVNAAAMLGLAGVAQHALAEPLGAVLKQALANDAHVLVQAEVRVRVGSLG